MPTMIAVDEPGEESRAAVRRARSRPNAGAPHWGFAGTGASKRPPVVMRVNLPRGIRSAGALLELPCGRSTSLRRCFELACALRVVRQLGSRGLRAARRVRRCGRGPRSASSAAAVAGDVGELRRRASARRRRASALRSWASLGEFGAAVAGDVGELGAALRARRRRAPRRAPARPRRVRRRASRATSASSAPRSGHVRRTRGRARRRRAVRSAGRRPTRSTSSVSISALPDADARQRAGHRLADLAGGAAATPAERRLALGVDRRR